MNNNNNNANNANKAVSETFQLSFKKIALYNFIFMGICLLISAVEIGRAHV